jgi:hypothetical protein
MPVRNGRSLFHVLRVELATPPGGRHSQKPRFFHFSVAFGRNAYAGGKKLTLPGYVLNARTVLVVIDPDTETSVTSPLANKKAQDDVETGFMKWGRLRPVLDESTADLIVTVRKGSDHPVQPTIGGRPTNDRPVIVQQSDNKTRIGA